MNPSGPVAPSFEAERATAPSGLYTDQNMINEGNFLHILDLAGSATIGLARLQNTAQVGKG